MKECKGHGITSYDGKTCTCDEKKFFFRETNV